MSGRRTGVRYREDTGFELRCQRCSEQGGGETYWPLTLEYWNPRQGMNNCRACMAAMRAARERERYAMSPELRAQKRARQLADRMARRVYQREYYRQNRAEIDAKKRAWYTANRDRINAARREAYRRMAEREVAA